MIFESFKAEGIAHISYLLGEGNTAVVVDPKRDIDDYLKVAQRNGLTIKYVLETHRQEDFVLGSLSLKEATGAKIVGGSHEIFNHCDLKLEDEQSLKLEQICVFVKNTPGHTPESVSYAVHLKDQQDCWGVFTGDTLFIGDAGRTDLTDPDKTKENAHLLYDSIHEKLKPLGPQALIFPAHGSGSVCGGAIASFDRSSIGFEMENNPAFTLSREEFARHKLHERIPRPPYFRLMEEVNLGGGRELKSSPSKVAALTPEEFKKTAKHGVIIDTRLPEGFAAGHIENAYSIWLKGLAVFGGWFVQEKEDVYLVLERDEDLEHAHTFLSRQGVGSVKGFLAGGFESWRDSGYPFEKSGSMSPRELKSELDKCTVFDVREINEYEDQGHIDGSKHCYVGHLEECIDSENISHDRKIVVTCSVGHRGSIAASIFLKKGYKNVHNLAGGMSAWNSLRHE